MRSVLWASTRPVHFHIVHDQQPDDFFTGALESWRKKRPDFRFDLYLSAIPDAYANLFAPCACQRLFLHDLLPNSIRSLIYIDSDTILLDDIGGLWEENTNGLPSDVVAGMVGENQDTATLSHYKDDAKHPYYNYTVHGLNSGVIWLNLEYLRRHPWNDELEAYRQNYTLQFYDQDLLNVYFANHPERLRLIGCEWNYRPDHCFFYHQFCSTIRLLHANRGVFHQTVEDGYPFAVVSFHALYEVMSSFAPTDLGACQGKCTESGCSEKKEA